MPDVIAAVPMPPESLAQIGALGIILLFLIKELFAYLKAKEAGKGQQPVGNDAVLKELQLMNSNHLHSIQDAIEDGNRRIVEALHEGSTRNAEILGEIRGLLQNRRG